jgi:recombination protein U
LKIRYPNGKINDFSKIEQQKILTNTKANAMYGKRGMDFERAINDSNEYYLSKGICVVHKKPTPIQIVKVDYPKRSAAKITEAYFRESSTTDYNGVYNGHYIDFEAKETKNKTSFPFKNFHDHQITHMKQIIEAGGIAFVLMYFSSLEEVYLFPARELIALYENKKQERKSIPLSVIQNHGTQVNVSIAPRIDYLTALKKIFPELSH